MRVARLVLSVLSIVLLTAAVGVNGQTPAQMEYERQQREYWRQQEQQRQEQQRQQQQMQENARRQQEESRRLNAPSSPGSPSYGAPSGGASAAGGGAKGAGGDAAAQALSAARAKWEKQPPLPPERNPLLGRWTRPASTKANSSDPFAALSALAKGGLCEALFGGGVFEFRPDSLVGMDARTPEQELDRVEYRGDAKHVVVIPKTTLKLMEFDFDGPDRINWKGQNCTMVRVAATRAAAGAQPGASTAKGPAGTTTGASTTVASAAPSSAASEAASSGGVLSLSVGAPTDGNAGGRKLWVLKEDAQVALIKGGLKSTPGGSALQNWMRACQSRTPDCATGARALQPYSIGIATTDASGHAQTPQLPAGRYWVLSDAKVGGKHVMWNQPVDLKDGGRSLTLDQRNAMPVD